MPTNPPMSLVTTVLFGLVVSMSCSSTNNRQTAARGAPRAENSGERGMMGKCPMKVPGTAASVDETVDGVAISFTTSTGDVAELRRRVRHMADMRARHHRATETGTIEGHEDHKPASGMGMDRMMMVPSTATVEDVEGGARIVLVPKDPARLAALRQHVRDHVGRMSRGECPMMAMRDRPEAS